MRKLAAVLLALVAVTNPASAAWSGYYQIKVLKAHTGGIIFTLDGFSNSDPDITCSTSAFSLLNTAQNYDVRSSFLLAAHMAGQEVSVSFYGCANSGDILVNSVQLN